MIVVTGATGKLGRHVVELLLERLPATEIAVAVRNPKKASDLAARGVQVRFADYNRPETLAGAFLHADKLLLISGNEVGQRAHQHANAVAAARHAGVCLLAYTSILRADRSELAIAEEHVLTEQAIRHSSVPFVFLRNGWYFESYTENLGLALEHSVIFGSAGDGRIAAATRRDYAEAAATVLTGAGHQNKIYELAGDAAFTMTELAAEVSRQAGRPVAYRDLPADPYRDLLLGFGLPPQVVAMLIDADLGVARGELDSTSHELSRLIQRPTTPLSEAVRATLAMLAASREADASAAAPRAQPPAPA